MANKQNTDAVDDVIERLDGMETVAGLIDDDGEQTGELEYSARSRSIGADAAQDNDAPVQSAEDNFDADMGENADDKPEGNTQVSPGGDPYADAPNKHHGKKRSTSRGKTKGTKRARRPVKKAAKKPETDPAVAAREKKHRRRGIFAGTVVTFTAVILALVLALDMTGRSTMISGPLATILAPIQSAVASVSASISEKLDAFGDKLALERELAETQQELAATSVKTARYDEVVAENERLRALMNNYEKYEQYDPMFARVIGKDTGNWYTNFTVDKGTSSGVEKGMTVMSADGVVGRVVEVGLNYAKVLTIVDGSSGVAVLIERTRDNGVIRGMVDDTTGEYLLQMNYLIDLNDVRTGDTVLTSGLDGVFPKGLPIGTVTQISRQSSELSQYVVVTPYTDFEHVEEVLLLKVRS